MSTYFRTMVAVGLLAAASPGVAQTVEPAPLPTRQLPPVTGAPVAALRSDDSERRAELQLWIRQFSEWQQWSEQWRGRRQPGWFTGFRDRSQKPAPPSWLPARCEGVFDDQDPLREGCLLLTAWREDGAPAQQIRQVRIAATTDQEEPSKTTWWEHIHTDVMWPALQWQNSIYGVVGTHVATEVGGRLQVFTAPGVMLLSVPGRNGMRLWKFAANYGIGYRLMNFTMPGGRPAELHLNLAKMWLVSGAADVVTGRTIDLMGFSVTFKRE
jgi:hypothetical protein